MSSYVPPNDSDSDSLPDLAELFPKPSNEICDGDIVWAKFKGLHWPALVRHVYKKEKKITVWYADDPGKTFKIPLQNVYIFHDVEKSTKFRKDAIAAGVIAAHDGLVAHASLYLNRRAEGYNDDPLKFFDQTYPYLLAEEFLKMNPNSDKEMFSGMMEPLYINNKATAKSPIRKRGDASVASKSDDEDDCSDMELIKEEDSDEEKVTSTSKEYGDSLPPSLNNEFATKIVSCITSGKADMHLSNVIFKKIPSVHHNFYLKAMKSNKKDLDYISYGPIENLKMLREIIFYLLDLYDRISCNRGKKRLKLDLPHSGSSKIEDARYVASVWLPEAVIFAISHVNDISLSDANKQFHEKSLFNAEVGQNASEETSSESSIKIKSGNITENREHAFEDVASDVNMAGTSQKPRLVLADVLPDISEENYTQELPSDSSDVHFPNAGKSPPKRVSNCRRKSRR